MNSNDMVLFKRALIEATIQKYNDELSQCDTDDTVSQRHKRIMKRIINNAGTVSVGYGKKWSNKKRIVAVLIAAILLLLGGLTVYAKRDAIVHFVEQVFEKFTKASYQEEPNNETGAPDTIEQIYIPTYIPDGFELQETDYGLTSYQIRWQNSDGITILYDQEIIGAIYSFDNEHSGYEEMSVGEYVVYSTHGFEKYTYLWSDESYSYSISVLYTDNILFEEVEKMILSISKAE